MFNKISNQISLLFSGHPMVHRCPTCGIADNFPGVVINNHTCNYCKKREKMAKTGRPIKDFCYTPPILEKDRIILKKQMEAYFKELKKQPGYHGIVCYSGGKDSTYVLYLLTKVYGLNILPVTVDIGCLNSKALKNIKKTLKKIGIKKHILIDKKVKLFRKIHKFFLLRKKSMFIEGNNPLSCLVCHHVMDMMIYQIAQKYSCDFIATGLDRFQTPDELNFLLSDKLKFYHEIKPETFFKDLTVDWTDDVFKELFTKQEIKMLNKICLTSKKNIKMIYPIWILGTTTKDIIQNNYDKKLVSEVYDTNCAFLDLANYIYWHRYGCIINEMPDSNHGWEDHDDRKYTFKYCKERYGSKKFFKIKKVIRTLKQLNLKSEELK